MNLVAAGPRDEFIDGKRKTFVYLFGRSSSGKSYAVKTKPLLPYFFAVNPSDEIVSKKKFRISFSDIQAGESREHLIAWKVEVKVLPFGKVPMVAIHGPIFPKMTVCQKVSGGFRR